MPKPDFATARAEAETVAQEQWKYFAPVELKTYLQDFYTESEHCWVFYRHPKIVLPPEQGLRDWAICVNAPEHDSMFFYDLSTEPELAQKYADLMSRHFIGEPVSRRELTTVFDEFRRRKGEQ